MSKKEFQVGESFQCGFITLKCELNPLSGTKQPCQKCYFSKLSCCYVEDMIGECEAELRKDGKDVHFVKCKRKT